MEEWEQVTPDRGASQTWKLVAHKDVVIYLTLEDDEWYAKAYLCGRSCLGETYRGHFIGAAVGVGRKAAQYEAVLHTYNKLAEMARRLHAVLKEEKS